VGPAGGRVYMYTSACLMITDAGCRMVDAGCCMLYDVCCMLYAVCCMLYAVCCMLGAGYCMLYAVCCMLLLLPLALPLLLLDADAAVCHPRTARPGPRHRNTPVEYCFTHLREARRRGLEGVESRLGVELLGGPLKGPFQGREPGSRPICTYGVVQS
jgi:hypothetical protein